MSFEVGADRYAAFMGRFSAPLGHLFVDAAGVTPGQRVLDVGCGTGALTEPLVERLGASAVAAVDPSEAFVAAVREKFGDVDVRRCTAEDLPYDDDDFDAALAQLVVHFMTDPVAGLREMRRVTKPGGVVAANVWNHAGDAGPLSLFWRAVKDLDPDNPGEGGLAGASEGQLQKLFEQAGLLDIAASTLTVQASFASFDDWWTPYTYGIGPSGGYVVNLDDEARRRLREHCAQLLPDGPFELSAAAWTVLGRA